MNNSMNKSENYNKRSGYHPIQFPLRAGLGVDPNRLA
jgi:hypothetical protein